MPLLRLINHFRWQALWLIGALLTAACIPVSIALNGWADRGASSPGLAAAMLVILGGFGTVLGLLPLLVETEWSRKWAEFRRSGPVRVVAVASGNTVTIIQRGGGSYERTLGVFDASDAEAAMDCMVHARADLQPADASEARSLARVLNRATRP